jgi:mannose-6-phosphate isomerase
MMDPEITETAQTGIGIVPAAGVRVVTKPWGWERWLAGGGPSHPYMLKVIRIRAPYRTSLQFHARKRETNHLLEGHALLHYSDALVDAARFKAGGYSPAELEELAGSIVIRRLEPGDTIHVPPGFLHRIEATDEDILLVEASTDDADDVFRLQDDACRSHGRIDGEHG